MKKYILILMLSACAPHAQTLTPVTVEVPIASKCTVDIPEIPQSQFDALPPDSSLRNQTLAIIGDYAATHLVAQELLAILKACAGE